MFNYYRDFGTLGVTIIPLLGGIGINSLYFSFRKNPTLSKITFFGLFLFGITFSFFNSPFGFLWYVYTLIITYLVFRYISKQKNQEK